MIDANANILWQRVGVAGHDACRLERTARGWQLKGAAAYMEDDAISALSYHICHDDKWVTQSARISGWSGSENLDIAISRDADGTWLRNGIAVDSVQGAVDIDLGFTPATNTTAIRRLNLDVGQRMAGMAAWLDPADWKLKPLEQFYLRKSDFAFEYGSPGHGFRCDLAINGTGFVTEYPGLWTSV